VEKIADEKGAGQKLLAELFQTFDGYRFAHGRNLRRTNAGVNPASSDGAGAPPAGLAVARGCARASART
jgi:hypothetical protein